MVTCNVWCRSCSGSAVRRNLAGVVFVISILVNVGMWFERFVIIVTSLHRDFLPSSWTGYVPDLDRDRHVAGQLRPVLHVLPAVLPLPADDRDGRGEAPATAPGERGTDSHATRAAAAAVVAWARARSRSPMEPCSTS
jgi:hypothetical protein